jgi:hypothetical protein
MKQPSSVLPVRRLSFGVANPLELPTQGDMRSSCEPLAYACARLALAVLESRAVPIPASVGPFGLATSGELVGLIDASVLARFRAVTPEVVN